MRSKLKWWPYIHYQSMLNVAECQCLAVNISTVAIYVLHWNFISFNSLCIWSHWRQRLIITSLLKSVQIEFFEVGCQILYVGWPTLPMHLYNQHSQQIIRLQGPLFQLNWNLNRFSASWPALLQGETCVQPFSHRVIFIH